MGELIPTAGSQQGPIRFRKENCRHVIFVFGKGTERRIELAHSLFIERVIARHPKKENQAELEDVTLFRFTTRYIKVRGNKAAMDRLERYTFDSILSHVQQREGVNPAEDENKNEPVVYSVELIEEPASKPAKGEQKAKTNQDAREHSFGSGNVASGRP